MSGTTFSKLPVMIVALVIGLILTFTAVMPLVSDYSDAKTFTNEGYYRMTHYSASDDATIVISWDYTKPNTLVVNDVDINITGPNSMGVSVLIDTNMLLRAGISASGIVTNVGYFLANSAIYAEVSHNDSLTITFNGGSYSGTVRGSSVSGSYTDLYIPSKDGAYIMKNKDTPAYVLADTEILAYGITDVKKANNSSDAKGISISGTVDDVTLTVWRGSSGFTTIDPVVHSTAVNSYIDLYQLDKITFTGTVTETVDGQTVTTNTDITYSYFLVPYEVTADPDNPTAYKNLVSVLPLFALILLVAGAASLVYFKNKD